MSIVIFGPSGNVGNILTSYLIDSGYNVIGISRNPHNSLLSKNYKFISCARQDYIRIGAILESINDIEAIIDLSGFHVEDVNTCLQAISHNPVPYIFMSSFAVAEVETNKYQLPIREAFYKRNSSLCKDDYSQQKLLAEKLVFDFSVRHSVRGIILRSAEIIGTADAREQYFLLRFTQLIRKLLVPDGGNNELNPVDVRDVARALSFLLENDSCSSGIYHIVGPETITLHEYIARFAGLFELNVHIHDVPWNFVKTIKPDCYFPFFPRTTEAVSERLKDCGFSVTYSLVDSFLRSRNVFLKHHAYKSDNNYKSKAMLTIAEEARIIKMWKDIVANSLSINKETS